MKSTNDKKYGKVQNRIVQESADRIGNIKVQIKCKESLGRKRSKINKEVDRKCDA